MQIYGLQSFTKPVGKESTIGQIVGGSQPNGSGQISDGVNDRNGFGWRRISGNGYAFPMVAPVSSASQRRLYFNSPGCPPGDTYTPGTTRWEYRFPGVVSSGVLAVQLGCEHHIYQGDDREDNFPQSFRLMHGDTVVLDLTLTRDDEGQAVAVLTGGDPDDSTAQTKSRETAFAHDYVLLNSILLVNLDTRRATILQGYASPNGTSAVFRRGVGEDVGHTSGMTRYDAELIGHDYDAVWGTGDEETTGGTIAIQHAAVDRLEIRYDDVTPGASEWAAVEFDSNELIVATQPVAVIGDGAAQVLDYCVNSLPGGFAAIGCWGVPSVRYTGGTYVVDDYGRSLCGAYDETSWGGRPLSDPLGPLSALIAVGVKRFLLSIGSVDIGRDGVITGAMTVTRTSGTSCTVQTLSDRVRIVKDGSQTDLLLATYPTIESLSGALSGQGLTVSLLPNSRDYLNLPTTFMTVMSSASSCQGVTLTLYRRDIEKFDQMKFALSGILSMIQAAGGEAIVCTPYPMGCPSLATYARTAQGIADCEEWRTFILGLEADGRCTSLDLWSLLGEEDGTFSQDAYALSVLGICPVTEPTGAVYTALETALIAALRALDPKDVNLRSAFPNYVQTDWLPVTVGPVRVSVMPERTIPAGLTFEVFQNETTTIALTVEDGNGDPVDLSGKELKFVVQTAGEEAEGVFEVPNSQIVVSGDDDNLVTVPLSAEDLATATHDWQYRLWDVTSGRVLAHGTLIVRAALAGV